jgi:coenzyme Q-binding protein COQ10
VAAGPRLMRTVDELVVAAPPAVMYALAADVCAWPRVLPHYRWVRQVSGTPARGVAEMAAWRPFGPARWPTWWRSEMVADPARHTVHYRHVAGVTRGMDVAWTVDPHPRGAVARIVHEWEGPAWPLVGRAAAAWVIGPVFVHGIASRTLAGLGRAAEHRAREVAA